MIFYRILDNKLYHAGEVDKLGFEESEGIRIPDDYLEKKEFTIMRTCHGLGDWGIISALPRILKQKYPDCKVYVPSAKLLNELFGNQKDNWGTFENPFLNVEHIFKNNPYVDDFKDYIVGEIFHDHYRVYDKHKKDIPLTKQMLKFWQIDDVDDDCLPELYFSDEEKKVGDKIIQENVGDKDFGALLISSRYESSGIGFNEKQTEEILSYFLKKNNLPYFYYTYKPKEDFPFKFNGCLDMRNMDIRTQLYLRTKAKLNVGTHCGVLDSVSGKSKVYQVQRTFPINQNRVLSEVYMNGENYKTILDGDEFKTNILNGLPDKNSAKTTTSLKWKSDFIDFFRDDKFKKIDSIEVGSSLGHTTRVMSFLFNSVTALDNLSERHVISNKLNGDRDNIKFRVMDVYGENWDFDNMGVVVIDCIHDYEHVKADIQNSINTFNKPYIVFDDYGLFPDVKKGIDEFIESGVLRVEKKIGMSPGFEFSKTLNKVLKDWEGLICRVV
jgi:hypothetical protein|tara:strand:- start:1705 stop:3195 length:1491 start_codon:yes stop_codon:yes gene_type:complete